MKSLLNAIKSELQTDLTYVRDSDIYVTEDEDLIPSSVKFPAVGLKDGDITYAIETANQESDELLVDIIAYEQLSKTEASIMGDAATGKKGVLDIIADVKTSLTSNMLNGIVDVAVPVSEGGSEFIGDENEAIQKKRLTMRYEKYDP